MKRTLSLAVGTVLVATGLFAGGAFVSRSSSAAPPVAKASSPDDATRAALALRMKRKADAARNAFEDALARYDAGSATVEEVALWSRRTWDDDPDRASTTATTAFVDRALRTEKVVAKRVAAGHAPKSDALAAAYFRAEAEAREVGAPLDVTPSDPTTYR